ncbi:MAG: LON peptidase substrate-binding domain-containing protein [Alphaproteobacteria bacterium]
MSALPATLPIFPLAGVLLLPRGRLPLNVFEPRYLAMTRDAMTGNHMIGMVQPLDPQEEGETAPAVYSTGCAGRITAFEESDDGRYLITLTGLCRFAVVDELPLSETGYRRVQAAYDGYADDLDTPAEDRVERGQLLQALKSCFAEDDDVAVDWESIERTPSDNLVTSLAMMLPFSPSEKQALLEARDLAERARILIALMEMMAAFDQTGADETSVQ